MHIINDNSGWPDIHKTLFKKWGFFNSLAEEIGHPEDANLRPWFYTWSLLSRAFPARCVLTHVPPFLRNCSHLYARCHLMCKGFPLQDAQGRSIHAPLR